jgi:hypothetical protein
MDIEMIRITLWQNLRIAIGEKFTVPDPIGAALIRRGVAKGLNAPAPELPKVAEVEKPPLEGAVPPKKRKGQ